MGDVIMLKVFEAFAGVGSQRMALRNLGIDHKVVGICEIDKFALKSYEAIHGDCPNFGDISKIDVNDLPSMDLFTYSFPCQDLSIAGKQKGLGENTRSGLLYECEKIIEAKRPKYLLLENVKNLVGKNFKNDFDKWLNYLEELGYQDIKSIRSELFSGYFASENPEVFGLVRVNENGKKKFIKQDTSLIDSYFLRRFDKLRKYTLGEVIFDGAECMDPFKVKFEEKKKVLRNYKLF
jgi:DNA (cytosine-5)-methyltransferase 1